MNGKRGVGGDGFWVISISFYYIIKNYCFGCLSLVELRVGKCFEFLVVLVFGGDIVFFWVYEYGVVFGVEEVGDWVLVFGGVEGYDVVDVWLEFYVVGKVEGIVDVDEGVVFLGFDEVYFEGVVFFGGVDLEILLVVEEEGEGVDVGVFLVVDFVLVGDFSGEVVYYGESGGWGVVVVVGVFEVVFVS